MALRAAAAAAEKVSAPKPRDTRHLRFIAVTAVSIVFYVFLGAIPATVILVFAGMLVLGVRKPLILTVVPTATTVVLWLIFSVGLGLRIPLW